MHFLSFPDLSERLKKVLAELETITQQIDNASTASNDNGDDFLTR
jgi:hypothetical protein